MVIKCWFSDGVCLDSIDLNDINFYDYDFDEDDSANIVLIRLIAWCKHISKVKDPKNDKQRINAYSMASNKGVGLVFDKRWKVVEW